MERWRTVDPDSYRALFRRVATQVGVGVVAGNIIVVMMLGMMLESVISPRIVLPPMAAASLVMLLVGLAALGFFRPLLFEVAAWLAAARQTFVASAVLTAVTFFGIGSLRSKWSPAPWWRAGLETLAIGMLAASDVPTSPPSVAAEDQEDIGPGQSYLDNITAEYLLNENGNLRLKVFNDRDRTQFALGEVVRVGGRLVFSKDFDTIRFFGRKEEEPTIRREAPKVSGEE